MISRKKQRTTPVDRPEVLLEWQTLRDEYLSKGMKAYTCYATIALEYGCSRDCVRLWLEPDACSRARKKNIDYYSRVLSKNDTWYSNRLAWAKLYSDIRYHIDRYLHDAMQQVTGPFTMGDVVSRLHKQTGILFRERTLEKLCQKHAGRTGQNLLAKVQDSPVLYQLAP